MSNYDATHEPPAPVALVTLLRMESDVRIDEMPMVIDSGADVTVLPKAYADQIGLELSLEGGAEVELYGGERRVLPSAQAVISMAGFRFSGRYLVDEGRDIGVIGRNLLNYVVVELNDPMQMWFMRRT
jgi:predicted aspartyl protease